MLLICWNFPAGIATLRHQTATAMRISRLRIKNFRSIKELELELGETTVFIGPNNAGKTAILDAIRIALTRRWGQRGTGFSEYDVHLANETDGPRSPPASKSKSGWKKVSRMNGPKRYNRTWTRLSKPTLLRVKAPLLCWLGAHGIPPRRRSNPHGNSSTPHEHRWPEDPPAESTLRNSGNTSPSFILMRCATQTTNFPPIPNFGANFSRQWRFPSRWKSSLNGFSIF